MTTWRLLDTPPLSAADNMCLDAVLAEQKGEGKSPDTIRFLRFKPRCVLVGLHQSVDEEIRLDYCAAHGIDINRRNTGGGALFFDENQLGWEIIVSKGFFGQQLPTPALFEKLCRPMVTALGTLGVAGATYRPRNDIEINGRKISGTGGMDSGDAFLFQGTMLVDFDVNTMLRALRIPVEKLKAKEIDSVKERVTCLNWELGHTPPLDVIKRAARESFEEHLGITLVEAGLTDEEQALFEARRASYRAPAWIDKVKPRVRRSEQVSAMYKSAEGMVRFSLTVDLVSMRVRDLYITGDFFAFPGRALYDLEAALRGAKLDRAVLHGLIREAFDSGRLTILGLPFEQFVKPLDMALEKVAIARRFSLPLTHANRISVTNGSFAEVMALAPSVLLLPYCAKLPDCDLRHAKGCRNSRCGREGCSIGPAWRLGGEKRMRRVTVVNYESLWDELMGMRKRGEKAFVGLCCQPFFAKHFDDFKRAGVPGVLLDIDDTTCYELGQARAAYGGTFEEQTSLDLDLLRRVLAVNPA